MFARLASASRLIRTPPPHARAFSSSIPRRASQPTFPPGIDPAGLEALKDTSIYQKLSSSPEALAAVAKFAEVMQAQGVDTTSGKPPSMFQMSKLLLKPEVREAAKGLTEAFQKAGIDLNSKDLLEEMSAFNAKLRGGGDSKS